MSDRFHRQSRRLPNYNYAQPGIYFITIATKFRDHLFGKIENGSCVLNSVGKIADNYWQAIPAHFPNAELDEFIIMPDHLHGIIKIERRDAEVQYIEPLRHEYQKIIPKSIGSIIRSFKASVTRGVIKMGLMNLSGREIITRE